MKKYFKISIHIYENNPGFTPRYALSEYSGTGFERYYLAETIEEVREQALLDYFNFIEKEKDICPERLERYVGDDGHTEWTNSKNCAWSFIAFEIKTGRYAGSILVVDSLEFSIDTSSEYIDFIEGDDDY